MANGIEVGEDMNSGRDIPRGRIMRLARYFLRLVGYVIVAGIATFALGFLIFYQHVASMRPPENPKADAIVVLTGGYQRIDLGVQLLVSGAGRRLLISGVNPATSGNHLRLLTRSTADLFQCCVDLGHDALDTAGNASETARWIKAHNYKTVILVTNNYHMPRSLAEIRRADDHSDFIPYPVESSLSLSDISQNPLLLRTLASEYVKYLLVQSRDWTGISI
ncbi:MAG: hypothetical protein JWM58_4342 [Rhizobium sp.]|nr:hypothetical protein [Rhizobium sp.]